MYSTLGGGGAGLDPISGAHIRGKTLWLVIIGPRIAPLHEQSVTSIANGIRITFDLAKRLLSQFCGFGVKDRLLKRFRDLGPREQQEFLDEMLNVIMAMIEEVSASSALARPPQKPEPPNGSGLN
ncbi:MAG TPA: hypothetical protein VG167_18740 [Verrucomicrobiae bacterium]|nr:hypothetical protein [Verrucomicrobiae bacterium]